MTRKTDRANRPTLRVRNERTAMASTKTKPDALDAPESVETPDAPAAPETETKATETTETTETVNATTETVNATGLLPLSLLLAETESAEAQRDNATPVADMVNALSPMVAWYATIQPTTRPDDAPEDWADPVAPIAQKLRDVMGAFTFGAVDAIDNLSALVAYLRPSVETTDRSVGTKLAGAWAGLRDVPGMGITDATRAVGDALVTRWNQSAPKANATKGTRSTRDPNAPKKNPDFGFKVLGACGACDHVHSGKTDNLNSERDKCITHAREAHGAEVGQGTLAFQSITVGLMRVGGFPVSATSDAIAWAKANGVDPNAPATDRAEVDAAPGPRWTFTREAL